MFGKNIIILRVCRIWFGTVYAGTGISAFVFGLIAVTNGGHYHALISTDFACAANSAINRIIDTIITTSNQATEGATF